MKKGYIVLAIVLVALEAAAGYSFGRYELKKAEIEEVELDVLSAVAMLNPNGGQRNLSNAATENVTETLSDIRTDDGIQIYDTELQTEKGTKSQMEETEFQATLVKGEGDSGKGTLVKIASATESSHYVQEGMDNTAKAAVDNNISTSWQDGVEGPGIGSWLKFELERQYQVSYLVFHLGNWNDVKGKDYFTSNYRPKKLLVTVGDKSMEVPFQDEKSMFRLEFSSPVPCDFVKVEVEEVYSQGVIYDETVIAEIGIYSVD